MDEIKRELLLIGTVHGDPDGGILLRNLLRSENPSVILVEVSPYGLAYRQRNGRRLRRILLRRTGRISKAGSLSLKGTPALRALFRQILMPFEYSASLRFSRESGARIHCIDLSSGSRLLIGEQWNDMLTMENLESLLKAEQEEIRTSFGRSYALASRLLSEKERGCLNPYVREWLEDPAWQEREAHLAGRVIFHFERMKAGRLAYVGGWQHLLCPTGAGTLCDRLTPLRPRRILLR